MKQQPGPGLAWNDVVVWIVERRAAVTLGLHSLPCAQVHFPPSSPHLPSVWLRMSPTVPLLGSEGLEGWQAVAVPSIPNTFSLLIGSWVDNGGEVKRHRTAQVTALILSSKGQEPGRVQGINNAMWVNIKAISEK